jgi:hypothetical protein
LVYKNGGGARIFSDIVFNEDTKEVFFKFFSFFVLNEDRNERCFSDLGDSCKFNLMGDRGRAPG